MLKKPQSLAVLLSYLAAVHVPVTVLTWRDLKKRPDDQIRGSKALWRIAATANTGGSVAYWLVGRRRPTQPQLAAS